MALSKIAHKITLKQQNKKHQKLGHKSKRQIQHSNKGRVSSIVSNNILCDLRELSRQQRRNQTRQIRANKREEVLYAKRQLGTDTAPPFMVSVIPLSYNIEANKILHSLTNLDQSSTVKYSDEGIAHISCARLKQRFAFSIPQIGDLYANLDLAKGSDTLLFVWKLGEELDKTFEIILSSIFSQGFHSVLHAVVGEEELPNKTYDHDDLDCALKNFLVISEQRSKTNHKKIRYLKELQTEISSRFTGHYRLFFLDKLQEVNLLLRQIGSQKRKSIFYKDERSHIVAEKLSFQGDGSIGTLQIQGYIRSQPLSVNSLIYIPGWGEFQMDKMELVSDPFPLNLNKRNKILEARSEVKFLDIPDPRLQETLESTCEVNELMEEIDESMMSQYTIDKSEGSQGVEEASVRKIKGPVGFSSYQSAWLDVSDGNETDNSDNEGETKNSDDLKMNFSTFPMAPPETPVSDSDDDYCSAGSGDDAENVQDDKSTLTTIDDDYDNHMDYDEEMEFLKKIKAAREDAQFPDEIDTPHEVPAKVRFQKFHGLESFHKSPWEDTYLPSEYSKIFDTKNFIHLKNRILKIEREGALQGWYVTIHLKDVPKHLYIDHIQSKSPVVVFSLLPFEQKMSVIHAVVKSHASGHIHPIKSKERLVFHIGFRRFTNCPIFSEYSNHDKHKYFRFFQPGQTVVATMYAPVTFPPSPVTVYRMRPNGDQDLVATGTLGYPNPKRIILKKIVLSGHPYKIAPRHSIIRYMFFNREDILFFKKIELYTKLGNRGSIEDPVGTHGHMKCTFDKQIHSHDTVLMSLYKRVFPKWHYDPFVPRTSSLLEKHQIAKEIREIENSSSETQDQEPKSKKRVKFSDERLK